jgi:pimeloyl-ACP methyl ester carboxylesterase
MPRLEFRQQIESARKRSASVRSTTLNTPSGTIEFADEGEGPPVLMCHGILGGHDAGVGMVSTYVGTGFRAVAPSRVGYFGSSCENPSVRAQADQYARLLDALCVERVIAIGYSAGGSSAVRFALRYPDRVLTLVLAASALPGAKPPPRLLRPLMLRVFGSDALFWTIRRFMPPVFTRMLGVPKGYRPTGAERRSIDQVADSIFPLGPRASGAAFDMFVGNPSVNAAPLEDLRVPTLLIHAADDTLAPYATALAAARRIPNVELITIARGGHLFLGHENVVRAEIQRFIKQHGVVVDGQLSSDRVGAKA